MQTHANYVKGKSFTLHQCQFFVHVVAYASGEPIFVEKKKNLMHRVAFAPCVIRILKVGKLHSMGHLFLRQISKKRITMKFLKNP